jgi:RimJ/RimL family protein N-acetyltransferase
MKTKPNSSVEEKQPVIFLKGKRLRLRPLEATDLERCTVWINDPEIRDFITVAFPISSIQEQSFVMEATLSKDRVKLAIETHEGVHVGNIDIHGINWINRTAETGTMIGDKNYWSQGYGTEAKMLLLDYAFNTLGLRKLHSGAYAYNERSINYSLTCGYKIIGRKKKEKFRKGEYHDVVLLEVFKDEWQRAYATWTKSQNKKLTIKKIKR